MAEAAEPKVVELGPEDTPVEGVVDADKENQVEELLAAAAAEAGEEAPKLNRGEKKCRKAM